MIKWLNKISSPLSAESSPRNLDTSSGRARAAKLTVAYASDPNEWERIFEREWRIVEEVLERKFGNVEHESDYDEVAELLERTTNMCTLLMLEVNSQPEPTIGPILDRFFTEQILEKVLDWAIQLAELLKPTCQLALVKIYENIVSESHSQNHCLLVHKPILIPLLRLCEWSRRVDTFWTIKNSPTGTTKKEPSANEKHFVLLLNQICMKLAEDRTLLHFFFSRAEGSEQFVVFTQLITFLYEPNDIGQLARDALLLILSVSAEHPQIAEFVAYKTAFCPVVATGLSGTFSQLPRQILGDGGERFIEDEASDTLADFHSSVLFCNAVAQAAHPDVVQQISQFFYTGFLINVVKPALLQDDRQYIAASLTYLQLCIETITESVLLRSVIQMLLVETDESSGLLFEKIINYTKSGDKASICALSLIDSLVKLCCEDVMLALVFRPLLTNHLANKKELAKVYNRIRCQKLAQQYLDCIPKCMLSYNEVCSHEVFSQYLRESKLKMDARSEQCRSWKWKYDGVVSNSFCLPSESDDDATCHVSFSRLSSSRSSMSMATMGLNRYTNNSHISHDFNIEKVCDLGQQQHSSEEEGAYGSGIERGESFDEIEEDHHFVLPPIDEMTSSKIMSSSCVDYFHIAGLDDLSESDDPSTVPPLISKLSTDNETDSDLQESGFILSGWQNVKDEETWRSLLEKQKVKNEMTGDEIVKFLDVKMEELDLMKQEEESEENEEENEKENVQENKQKGKKLGFSVYKFPERSGLLKVIFDGLDTLCDNSLSFNVELCCLISSLATYPQPILANFLLDEKEDKSGKCLLTILQSIQTRIEVMSEGIEGFEVWVSRGLKSLDLRMARIHKQAGTSIGKQHFDEDSLSPNLIHGRSFRHDKMFRMHTHKHVDSPDTQRDDATAKQTALAAIFVAHLSQILASIVLQQSLII